ncbi:MAG: hypothetical protein ABIK89_23345 [Planctomycetota bacterium]
MTAQAKARRKTSPPTASEAVGAFNLTIEEVELLASFRRLDPPRRIAFVGAVAKLAKGVPPRPWRWASPWGNAG